MMGSAMVLIEGYCGTILYTGDIRYDRELFHAYQQLYDPDKIREMAGK